MTLKALFDNGILSDDDLILCADKDIRIENFTLRHIRTSHDCEGSGGYIIGLPDERSVAVVTDLGYISDDIKNSISGCDLVMLESNHDINMLKKGSYPYSLKERILSDKGHLSNTACAALLPELVSSGTTRIILAHLSQQNNLPTLALSTSRASLVDAGFKENVDYILYVAPVFGGRMFTL